MAEKDPFDRVPAAAEAQGDAEFATRVLAELLSVPVPGSLESRILADFDAVAAKRKSSRWAVLTHPLRSLRDALWPNAPAWKPASILALSLLFGLVMGALVPSSVLANVNPVQDETVASDVVPDVDLFGDF